MSSDRGNFILVLARAWLSIDRWQLVITFNPVAAESASRQTGFIVGIPTVTPSPPFTLVPPQPDSRPILSRAKVRPLSVTIK